MSDQNNNGTSNNNGQEEREVEAAVGGAYVQVGDRSEDGSPPVATIQGLETAQPEEAFVATQLDVIAKEQEGSEGSSTGKLIIGKLSEFIGILTANCCTAILRPFQRCFWS